MTEPPAAAEPVRLRVTLRHALHTAMAVLLGILVFIITAVQFWINSRNSHEGVD